MHLLLLSIVTLFAGPLLYQWLRGRGRWVRVLDQVIVAGLLILVGLLLVPETLARLGWLALVLIVAGYLAPLLLEQLLRRAAETLHIIALLLALGGLCLHEMLDGAGLAASSAQPGLGLAIVLHRLGVGLMLWLMVTPVLGRPAAFGVLVLMAVATVFGYLLSGQLLQVEGGTGTWIIQACIIGTIIHSLVHGGHVHRH